MLENCKSFFFTFDLIGTSPQLLIFNNKRYKSLLSTFLSIIIIFISIFFSIFSLVQYLKFDSPIVGYSKDNDENTDRNFKTKDLILIFQLIDSIDTMTFKTINESIAYYQALYNIVYNNGTVISIPLDIDYCEFGKNVDEKFKEMANINNTYGRKMEEFFCINFQNDENLSLFYYPNIGFSFISLLIYFKNNSIYIPENLQSLIISENNIIDHYNKKNPIKKSYIYQFTASFSSLQYTSINYNFQYIRYESDEGLLYKKSRILNGLSFSDINLNRNSQEDFDLKKNLKELNYSIIGKIDFSINKSNFDNYKRNYQRLQSLLAEVSSVVSLLFEIGRQISNILGSKKMNKDIFEFLLNKKKEKAFIYHNNNINNLFSNKKKQEITIDDKDKTNSNSPYLEKSNEVKLNISNELNKENNNFRIEKIDSINDNKILSKINYYHIIKSFLCFKDEKTKLINNCYEYINRDKCIENILERFYNIENIYFRLSNEAKKKVKIIKKKKQKE